MTGRELFEEFAVKAYESPLSQHRDSGRIADTSDPVSVIMLVVDLDTEVSMNGVADFIGNSTGRYAGETVRALEAIGCHEDAGLLRQILDVAAQAGMTHEAMQADRSSLPPYALTSFAAIHRGKWDEALGRIESLFRLMNLERVQAEAARFVAKHEQVLLQALGR